MREWAVLLVLCAGVGVAAEPQQATHVPGVILCGFSPATAETVASAGSSPVEWLRPFGVTTVKPGLNLSRQRGVRLAQQHGLDRLYRLELAPDADVVRLSERIARLPGVEYAHPDYLGQGGGGVDPNDTHYPSQWNLENNGQTGGTVDADIDADEAWRIAIGRRETVIAVLDSGADGDHIDLRRRIAPGGYDYVGGDFDPEADHPHGTWCSGVIGADANNRFGLVGVNWRAGLQQIKVLNSNNQGTTTDLIEGLMHAAAQGVHVASQSLINYPDVPALAAAVQTAFDAGVIQIGCNGNSGTSTFSYPSAYPQQIRTGWTNSTDNRDPSSNFTSVLDVVAPGSNVPGLLWGSTVDTFQSISGCSFATPHVAGVTGLLLSVDPTLTQAQVADILRSTAEDQIGNPLEDVPGRDDFYGWGRVNAQAALASLGIQSEGRIHVDGIELRRVDTQTLSVEVTVVDELTGLQPGIVVRGTLTQPDLSTVALDGEASDLGIASMTYAPGGTLPAGAFTYTVGDLQGSAGQVYEPSANHLTSRKHDPDLNGIHVNAIETFDDFTTLTVDVQVVDDDDEAEGGVTVRLLVTPPTGSPGFRVQTTRNAVGGVAHIVITPRLMGTYTFEVNLLSKTGFIYEPVRNVVSVVTRSVLDSLGDADLDGVANIADNCPTTAGLQTDTDGDTVGDACDVCAKRGDAAQRDTDGDGAGDRCDCSPYDPTSIEPAAVDDLRFDGDKQTMRFEVVRGADFYDISRGGIAALDGIDYGACREENHVGAVWTDTDVPAPGQGFFYLIRADDAGCGPGSLGPDVVNGNPAACVAAN